MNSWTPEQYAERERVMRESDAPLLGSKPGLGYVGSREMLADLIANHNQKASMNIAMDILEDTLSKPPNSYNNLYRDIETLVYIMDDYPTLRTQEVMDWIIKAREIINQENN